MCRVGGLSYDRRMESQIDRVTSGRTDMLPRHSSRYAYASRGKNRDASIVSRRSIARRNATLRSPRQRKSARMSPDVVRPTRDASVYREGPTVKPSFHQRNVPQARLRRFAMQLKQIEMHYFLPFCARECCRSELLSQVVNRR